MLGNFVKKNSGFLWAFGVCIVYNLYFLALVPDLKLHYLEYLNILIGAGLTACFFFRFRKFSREERERGEDRVRTLEDELRRQFTVNCDLQDYIARWCHEVKLPLSAALLTVEKLESGPEKSTLQEQLERMRGLLTNALLGCKVQSSLFDLQIRPVSLMDCVRTSIHNNQFFLIQKHFELDIQVGEETVYTDKAWLVYILDQLIGNAVKYAGEQARLTVKSISDSGAGEGQTGGEGTWLPPGKREVKTPPDEGGAEDWDGVGKNGRMRLIVEDGGVGIREDEIRRVFDRGFTGSNYHNGQYKSTGMGLYMAKQIADRLGHGLSVESVWGEYTRFEITFADNRDHFLR